jgi:hypothetical protein
MEKMKSKKLKDHIGSAVWTSNLCCWILLVEVDEKNDAVYCKEAKKDEKTDEFVELPIERREFPEGLEMTVDEAYQFFIEDYE